MAFFAPSCTEKPGGIDKEAFVPDTVLYQRTGRVATLTYNRPHAMNAVNAELRADLNAAWVRLRDDDEAWVGIVTGAGRAFCAGADLKEGGAGDAVEHSLWEVPGLTSLENGLEIWKPPTPISRPTPRSA